MNLSRQTVILSVIFAIPILVLYYLVLFSPEEPPPEEPKEVSIGFIDVQSLFENSSRGKQQIALFQEEFAARSKKVEEMNAKVESLKAEVQRLTQQKKEKEAKEKLPQLQKAQKDLVELEQRATQELQKTQADVDKAFMGQLKAILDEMRREEDLDIIQAYDSSKTLSFDPDLDITQKALVKYNAFYPAEKNGPSLKAESNEAEAPKKAPAAAAPKN